MPGPSTVNECMRRNPLTIKQGANLVEAIETIVNNKLTGLTVVDDGGLVVGVLSELDCIRAVLTSLYNDGDPEHALVSEVMTRAVNSCKPGDGIVEVAQSMLDTRQRRRPVIEDGKLVGQVSSANILWALMEHSRRKTFAPKA
ncbi:CBS domain-containing protein [Haliea sp. E17]|uniref:CBS domain-containing protein n=1 Tax=Haliea sp. E17 TaxID=3401576 RepID=UPI003AAB1C74